MAGLDYYTRLLVYVLVLLGTAHIFDAVAQPKRALMMEDRGYVNTLQYGSALNATTLNAAITALGSDRRTLFLSAGAWTLASNVTVPCNIHLLIPTSATVSINSGITLSVCTYFAEGDSWLAGAGTFTHVGAHTGETSHLVSGCAPATSGTATIGAFACAGRLQVGGTLVPVVQAASAVGPLSNGTNWLALDFETARTVSGWTRQSGTRFLYQISATLPATPPGTMIFAKATVAAGVVTTVTEVGTRRIAGVEAVAASRTIDLDAIWVMAPGAQITFSGGATLSMCGTLDAPPQHILTGSGTIAFCENTRTPQVYPQWWGARQDGVTDDYAALAAMMTAMPGGSDSTDGAMQIRLLSGALRFGTKWVINRRVAIVGSGNRPDVHNNSPSTVLLKASTLNDTAMSIETNGVKMEGFLLRGESGNGGMGIHVRANSVLLRDIAVVKMGSHGIWVGDPTTSTLVNANSWTFLNVGAMDNGVAVSADGFHFSDNDDSGADRDANAGTCIHCYARGNSEDGIEVNKASANTFIGSLVESNLNNGIVLTSIAGTNRLYGGDSEQNTVKDLVMEAPNIAGGGGNNAVDINCCSGSPEKILINDLNTARVFTNNYIRIPYFDQQVADTTTADILTLYANRSSNDAAYMFFQVRRDGTTAANRRGSIDVKDVSGTVRLLSMNPSGGPVAIGGTTTPNAHVQLSIEGNSFQPARRPWSYWGTTISSPEVGMMGYCTDCTISACNTAGSGAWIYRTTAGWTCPY